MGWTCLVIGCRSHYRASGLSPPGITAHGLPSDPALKDAWLAAIGRKDYSPGKHAKICSQHFTDESFTKKKKLKNKFLKKDAVPSLFPEEGVRHKKRPYRKRKRLAAAAAEFAHEPNGNIQPKIENPFAPNTHHEQSSSLQLQELQMKNPALSVFSVKKRPGRRSKNKEQFLDEGDLEVVSPLPDLKSQLENEELPHGVHIFLLDDNNLCLCSLSLSGPDQCPQVQFSVVINSSMEFRLFMGDVPIPASHVGHIAEGGAIEGAAEAIELVKYMDGVVREEMAMGRNDPLGF